MTFRKKNHTNKRSNNTSYAEKKNQNHIPCSFTYKFVCVDDNFSKQIALYRGENAVYKFIEAIHEEYHYCKKKNDE